jgi:hypothetical protein
MENNYAFIDGANLHKGIENLGWHLDYARFRVWLREKYGVARAYIFIGFIPSKKELYLQLEKAGYVLVYKEITYGLNGRIKGNCDADLVLRAAIDHFEGKFNEAVIVSSDGDYVGLVRFLNEKSAFNVLLSPANKCSYLLWKSGVRIVYLDSQRNKLEVDSPQIEKAPDKDETL